MSLARFVDRPRSLFDAKIIGAAALLRLGLLPVLLLLLAKYLPCSVELKREIVVQAARPTAMVTLVIARLCGGHPRTAVQIVLGTTALGIFVIPLWRAAGLAWGRSLAREIPRCGERQPLRAQVRQRRDQAPEQRRVGTEAIDAGLRDE